ncbi:MAG: ABC transporter permease [Dysgonomonas sp.]
MSQRTGIAVIFKREWKRILSSKVCIWGMMVAPLLSLLILVPMMNEGLPNKIPIAVVDLDNSSTSRSLIRQLDAFPKTDIKFKSLSFREAREKMERAEIYGIFLIPREFSSKAISGERPKLSFYTNNAFLISGSLLFQDLKSISVLTSASVGLKTAEAKGYSTSQIMPVIQPVSVESHPIANPYLNYSVYLNNTLLPGILGIIIMLFTTSSFGCEVKSGSGRLLMGLGNNSIFKVVVGKILPYTIIYMVISLLFMSVFYYYNKFPLNSGFFPMFLNYLFFIIASQGVGLILLSVFSNYRFAGSMASLIGSMAFSISGFSFPSLAMDPVLQSVSYLFPLRHFFLIYVDQALNGLSFAYSAYHYAALLAFMLLALLLIPLLKSFLTKNIYEE